MELKQVIECGGKTIEATVTSSGARITNWIRMISPAYANKNTVVIGLAVESKPNRKPKPKNDVATLQLCIWNKCLVVQLSRVDYIPRSLTKLLLNMRYVFVGVDVEADVAKLEEDHGLVCRKRCDVSDVALDKWPGRGMLPARPGLRELAQAVAGVADKPKHVAMSDWQAGTLSQQQIEYACVHAYACFRIGMKLRMLELI